MVEGRQQLGPVHTCKQLCGPACHSALLGLQDLALVMWRAMEVGAERPAACRCTAAEVSCRSSQWCRPVIGVRVGPRPKGCWVTLAAKHSGSCKALPWVYMWQWRVVTGFRLVGAGAQQQRLTMSV